ALEYKDWVAPQWEPRRWTALFFHDEYVALAAGHRPCALCRYGAYRAYLEATGLARADDVDAQLHAERVERRRKRLHTMRWPDVPSGAFVDLTGEPALVTAGALVRWNATTGYGVALERPRRGAATVITPETSIAALRAGYALT